MKKKSIYIALSLALVLMLSACGQDSAKQKKADNADTEKKQTEQNDKAEESKDEVLDKGDVLIKTTSDKMIDKDFDYKADAIIKPEGEVNESDSNENDQVVYTAIYDTKADFEELKNHFYNVFKDYKGFEIKYVEKDSELNANLENEKGPKITIIATKNGDLINVTYVYQKID